MTKKQEQPKMSQSQIDSIRQQLMPENKLDAITKKYVPQIKRGRPKKYTLEYIQEMIKEYVAFCYEPQRSMFGDVITDENGEIVYTQSKPFTLEGFNSFISWDKETFTLYEAQEEFSETLKNFRELVRQYAVNSLFTNSRTAGVIFNLKNNWGWVDKQITENTNVNVNDILQEQDKEEQIDV
jgi:hypothetical protein